MISTTVPTAQGQPLDLAPDAFGELEDSSGRLSDPAALRQQLLEEGYLYLRGALNREKVLEARRILLEELAEEGALDPNYPLMEGMGLPGKWPKYRWDVCATNRPLYEVLYAGEMIEIYEMLLQEPVRHFDHTWLRTVPRGKGTPPHLDSVYMNRGTLRLFTSWTPLGDVPIEQGGLIVMPRSHQIDKIRLNYGMRDVDTYCSNVPGRDGKGNRPAMPQGALSFNPVRMRRALGLPWLTREHFEAGDVIIFTIFTLHASLDNHTDRIRLSTDTRYQAASEPIDERWIRINGQRPTAHGPLSKRGMIC